VTLFGVGESQISLQLTARRETVPHNAFLHFALSSGVVPFAFFLAFWIQIAWRSVHAKGQDGDSFRLPYFIFAFVMNMAGDWDIFTPWGLFAVSVAAGSAVVYGKQHLLIVRVGNKIRVGLFPGHRSPKTSTVARPQS